MIQLLKGDWLIESDKNESGSVDLILTDLPYGTVKDLYSNTSWDIIIYSEKIMQIADRILRIMGSGSTLVACKNTNRNGIGIEINEVYFNIASERVGE